MSWRKALKNPKIMIPSVAVISAAVITAIFTYPNIKKTTAMYNSGSYNAQDNSFVQVINNYDGKEIEARVKLSPMEKNKYNENIKKFVTTYKLSLEPNYMAYFVAVGVSLSLGADFDIYPNLNKVSMFPKKWSENNVQFKGMQHTDMSYDIEFITSEKKDLQYTCGISNSIFGCIFK
ncbi:MAG: hypothetical protein WC459_02820 [Patescibacteria group bacterium]